MRKNETIERSVSVEEVISELGIDDECGASFEYAFDVWGMVANDQTVVIRSPEGNEIEVPLDSSFEVDKGRLCIAHNGTATILYVHPDSEIVATAYRPSAKTDEQSIPRLAAA